MSNFRPARVDVDDDNENEDNPLLRSIPYQQLRQHSRLDKILVMLFGTRLKSATIMLLLGFNRLRRFGASIPM